MLGCQCPRPTAEARHALKRHAYAPSRPSYPAGQAFRQCKHFFAGRPATGSDPRSVRLEIGGGFIIATFLRQRLHDLLRSLIGSGSRSHDGRDLRLFAGQQSPVASAANAVSSVSTVLADGAVNVALARFGRPAPL